MPDHACAIIARYRESMGPISDEGAAVVMTAFAPSCTGSLRRLAGPAQVVLSENRSAPTT